MRTLGPERRGHGPQAHTAGGWQPPDHGLSRLLELNGVRAKEMEVQVPEMTWENAPHFVS